jgi:hypothetical protein
MRGSDRSLVCAIRGPVTLITLGVLFALNNFTPYGFHQTWPVLLIVFGLLTLLRRSAEPVGPPPVGPAGYPPTDAGYNFPPPATGAGSYRQSQYPAEPAPPAGPAKGGFGSTASNAGSRPADSGETPGGAV